MHPIISQQIASYQAEEVRQRAELRRAIAPARRSRSFQATSRRTRTSLRQAWALLTTLRGA